MTRRPSRVTQADISRAIKGAEKAGLRVARVEVEASGKIVVFAAGIDGREKELEPNPW